MRRRVALKNRKAWATRLHDELMRRVVAVYHGRKLTPELAGHVQEDLDRWVGELVQVRAIVRAELVPGRLALKVAISNFRRKSLAIR